MPTKDWLRIDKTRYAFADNPQYVHNDFHSFTRNDANGGRLVASGNYLMAPAMDRTAIEERIRSEFEAAVAAVENAPPAHKAHEEKRLNRAVRRVYDLIGYGKLPPNWRALIDGE